jgi:hypothetical protein
LRFPSFDFAAPVVKAAVQFPESHLHSPQSFSFKSPLSAVQLRRNPQGQLSLSHFCQLRRSFKRSIEPGKQIPVDEQLVPQQGDKIRKRPAKCRHQLQVPQNQHGDQRRPDLGFDGIGICSKEGFDLQILFDRLERLTDILPINMILTKSRSNIVSTHFEVSVFPSSGCIWCMRNHLMLYGKQTEQRSHFRLG